MTARRVKRRLSLYVQPVLLGIFLANALQSGVAVILLSLVALGTYIILKRLHDRRRYANQHQFSNRVPSKWLRHNWRQWIPQKGKGRYSARLQDEDDAHTLRSQRSREPVRYEQEVANANEDAPGDSAVAGATVDRNTSVRSVMTLPAYSHAPRPTERILGREGERGGIDMVLEHPETVEEEEQRRDSEMESLYQIRLARRQEQVERDERRRLRREARERGDRETLEALRRAHRARAESAASSNTTAAALVAGHQAHSRERRVSAVQYADLGVARHDGTRLRANSNDSDRNSLLGAAAAMGGAERPAAAGGRALATHHRGRSSTSVLSLSSVNSDERRRRRDGSGGSGTSDFEVVTLNRSRSQSRGTVEDDVGVIPMPMLDPPQYDDPGWGEEAPPYESPVRTRAPQLPRLEALPAIEVTHETPVEEVARGSLR